MRRIAGTTIANQTLRRISEMIGSLFAALLMSAQPAPAEEPVVTEAPVEVQADVQAEVVAPEVAVETPAAVEAEAEAVAEAPAAPAEETICHRRVIPAERIGQRARTVRDCRPASEWRSRRR
jgi:hypothetical protein